MTTYEIRNVAPDEARAEVAEDGRSFRGHAAVYLKRTAIGNPRGFGFFEELDDHAAQDTTERGDDVRFLIEHDPHYIVARVSAGTLEVRDDSPTGWASYVPALDTELSYVRDMVTNLRNRNLTSMSFAFRVPKGGDTWTRIMAEDEEGQFEADLRVVRTFTGFDQSVVAYPAYPQTDAALRSAAIALASTADSDLIARKLAAAPELGAALADVADHAARTDPHSSAGRAAKKDTLRAVLDALARQYDGWAVVITRGPIKPHTTAVVEEAWNGRAQRDTAPADAAVLRHMHAWVDGHGDPDDEQSYRFAHHAASLGAPANIEAVRDHLDALARSDLPDADRAGVRRHLKGHLAEWKRAQAEPAPDETDQAA